MNTREQEVKRLEREIADLKENLSDLVKHAEYEGDSEENYNVNRWYAEIQQDIEKRESELKELISQ